MSLPGFTAERSLASADKYSLLATSNITSDRATRVYPALRASSLDCAMACGGDTFCFGMCLFLFVR
jgi:hypothetical protein